MNFRTKRTRQRKMSPQSHKSDLYFEAFVNAMKTNVGRIFFKGGKPVLISGIEVINTYNKRLEVQYLEDEKVDSWPVDDAEDFFNTFLTKTEFEKRQAEWDAIT